MIIWLTISLLLNGILAGLAILYAYRLGDVKNSDAVDILDALDSDMETLKEKPELWAAGYCAAVKRVISTLRSKDENSTQ